MNQRQIIIGAVSAIAVLGLLIAVLASGNDDTPSTDAAIEDTAGAETGDGSASADGASDLGGESGEDSTGGSDSGTADDGSGSTGGSESGGDDSGTASDDSASADGGTGSTGGGSGSTGGGSGSSGDAADGTDPEPATTTIPSEDVAPVDEEPIDVDREFSSDSEGITTGPIGTTETTIPTDEGGVMQIEITDDPFNITLSKGKLPWFTTVKI